MIEFQRNYHFKKMLSQVWFDYTEVLRSRILIRIMQRLLKDNKENLPVSTTWQFTLSRHLGFHLSQQNKRYIGTFKIQNIYT